MVNDQLNLGSPSITTATFFRGNSTQASIAIASRLAAVVAANPWLKGTLEKNKSKASAGLYLVHPTEDDLENATAGLFNATIRGGKPCESPVLDETMAFNHVSKAVAGTSAEVLRGSACIGNREPLLALTVLPDAKRPDDTFAVIFSLSHVIADGFTYYKLLSMISRGGPVEALNAMRKHSFEEQARTAQGLEEVKWLSSCGFICNAVCGAVCSRKPVFESYYVDEGRIRERKAAAVAGGGADVEFVSTNDVLCSDFCVAVRAGALLMPINFRERLQDITPADAGNYEGLLVFGSGDFANASLIRKTLRSGFSPFSRSGGGALPGCCEMVCSVYVSIVINWTFQFFQEVEVEGCEHMIHMPICPLEGQPFEGAIIYRPRRGETAVAILSRNLDSAGLQQKLPLGAAVRISTRAPAAK